jgi:hypothetical protein
VASSGPTGPTGQSRSKVFGEGPTLASSPAGTVRATAMPFGAFESSGPALHDGLGASRSISQGCRDTVRATFGTLSRANPSTDGDGL